MAIQPLWALAYSNLNHMNTIYTLSLHSTSSLIYSSYVHLALSITLIPSSFPTIIYTEEGESVNRPQMDINHTTCDIRTWRGGKHLFLDISPANIDTFVPPLYQCVNTRSIEVFWRLSHSLQHLHFNRFISKTTANQLWTALREKHFPP
jgi:hypothetical protein